jgi:hypothetical protein
MVFPWTLQWYLNRPSFPNFTGFDDLPGLISSVVNVFPSSSDVAVCVVRALLVYTTQSPTSPAPRPVQSRLSHPSFTAGAYSFLFQPPY